MKSMDADQILRRLRLLQLVDVGREVQINGADAAAAGNADLAKARTQRQEADGTDGPSDLLPDIVYFLLTEPGRGMRNQPRT